MGDAGGARRLEGAGIFRAPGQGTTHWVEHMRTQARQRLRPVAPVTRENLRPVAVSYEVLRSVSRGISRAALEMGVC